MPIENVDGPATAFSDRAKQGRNDDIDQLLFGDAPDLFEGPKTGTAKPGEFEFSIGLDLEKGLTGTIPKDIATGVVELPRALAKGVRDAGQGFLDLTDSVGDFLNENFADLGRPRLFNDKGEFDPELFAASKPSETGIKLPKINDPSSVTGKFVSGATQFLLPFGLAGKALKGVKGGAEFAAKNPLTFAGAKGAIADFTAFSGSEATLAELIQSVPELANPVTEFLSSDKDDSDLEGRLKNALEGVIVGGAVDNLVKAFGSGLRAYRAARDDPDGVQEAIQVFHGTDHNFKKFKISKIGAGEGNQAFGHGLYFAENQGIAISYANKLGTRDHTNVDNVLDTFVATYGAPPGMTRAAGGMLTNAGETAVDGNKEILLDALNREIGKDGPLNSFNTEGHLTGLNRKNLLERRKIKKAVQEAIRRVEAGENVPTMQDIGARRSGQAGQQGDGNLYEVELRASRDDFLDWDAPFSAQSPQVQRALLQSGAVDAPDKTLLPEIREVDGKFQIFAGSGDDAAVLSAPFNRQQDAQKSFDEGVLGFDRKADPAGHAIHAKLLADMGDDTATVSNSLLKLGIKGIKYSDASSRGKPGEGTQNFVAFSDKFVHVISRNGQPIGKRTASGIAARVQAEDSPVQAAAEPVEKPKPFQALGDIEEQDLIVSRPFAAEGAADDAARAVDNVGVPDDVSAKGLVATASRFKAATAALSKSEPMTLADLKKLDAEEAKGSVEVEDIVNLAKIAREGPSKQPETLTQWIKSEGGLQDVGGDVAQILGGANKLPGLISKKGQKLDDLALKAGEQGFIPGIERPTINQLLDHIEQDLTGATKVFREADQADGIAFTVAKEAKDELDRLGLLGLRSEDKLRERAQEALDPGARAASSVPADGPGPNALADTTLDAAQRADLGGEETFINFARIDSEDDVKSIIGQMADAFKGDIDTARRGVKSFAEIKQSADEIDAFEVLQNRRAGAFPSAEEQLAVRQLWTQSGRKLRDAAKEAAANPSPENLFAFRKMMSTHWVIQREVMAIRTETARALSAWRIPAGANDTFRMKQMEDAMDFFGGGDVNRKLAQRIAAAADDPKIGLGRIEKLVERSNFARTLDAVQEFWINALLSGPKTHLVNTISNTAVIGLRVAERAIAARISKAVGTDQGVEVGEAAAQAGAILNGFKDGLIYGYRTLRNGETGQFLPDDLKGTSNIAVGGQLERGTGQSGRRQAFSAAGFGIRGDNWLAKSVDMLGSTVNIPGRALTAADEMFKTVGYRMETNALAARMAGREVRDGSIQPEQFKTRMVEILDNPPDDIKLSAVEAASYQTFTDKSGKLAGFIKAGASEYPALRYVVPFVNTPARILSFTFERTPLAPLMSGFREAVERGGAERDLALAQVGAGSMIGLASVDLAMGGFLTGGGPSDPRERGTLRRAGWQPYSLRVDMGDGEMRSFAFNRLDPIGLVMGLAGDVFEIMTVTDWDSSAERDIGEIWSVVAGSIAKNLTNKTFFSGVSALFEMLSDPTRHADGYFRKFAGSFVPVAVKEVTRIDDPILRASSDYLTEIKSRLPILSEDVPARRDLFGREISFTSGLGWGYDMISPIYSKEFDPEPIDKMMIDQGWFIAKPSKRLSFGGVYFNTRNRPDIYSRYLELQGNDLIHPAFGMGQKDMLNALVEGTHPLSATFEGLTDGDEGGKEKFVRRIVGDFRNLARRQILSEFPDLEREIEQRQEERRIRLGR